MREGLDRYLVADIDTWLDATYHDLDHSAENFVEDCEAIHDVCEGIDREKTFQKDDFLYCGKMQDVYGVEPGSDSEQNGEHDENGEPEAAEKAEDSADQDEAAPNTSPHHPHRIGKIFDVGMNICKDAAAARSGPFQCYKVLAETLCEAPVKTEAQEEEGEPAATEEPAKDEGEAAAFIQKSEDDGAANNADFKEHIDNKHLSDAECKKINDAEGAEGNTKGACYYFRHKDSGLAKEEWEKWLEKGDDSVKISCAAQEIIPTKESPSLDYLLKEATKDGADGGGPQCTITEKEAGGSSK